MNSFDKLMSWVGTALASVGVINAQFDLTQLDAIVSMVCAIIGAVCSVVFTIIVPVVKKVIAARKDGKVDADELVDIIETAEKGYEEVKSNLDKNKKDD